MDVFVSDYIVAVKIYAKQSYIHSFTIALEWVTNLNDGSESLSFSINGKSYPAHSLCLVKLS